MPLSTLVIANNVAKTPRQMAKDIRAWDEYTSNSSLTDQELADKAKDLGLIDGLPLTYDISHNGTLIQIDLQSIETQFEVIRQICEELAPYHSVFNSHKIKAIKVDMAGKYGFIRITSTLAKKLRLIYDFVKTIDNRLAEDSEEIIKAIASTQTGKEKLHLIHILTRLIWTFRREYFNDIPVFLKMIASATDFASFYLFDYEQAIEEPELSEQITMLADERGYLRSNGEQIIEEIDDFIAHIKQDALSNKDDDLFNTAIAMLECNQDACKIVPLIAKIVSRQEL